jgi:hypothetical protein
MVEVLALRIDVLPDPFTTDDLLAAASAALERARSARRRSDIVIARLRNLVKPVPPQ